MKRLIFFFIILLLIIPNIYAKRTCPINNPCIIEKNSFSISVAYDKEIATIDKKVFYNNATKIEIPISEQKISSTLFKFTPQSTVSDGLYILNITVSSTDQASNAEANYFLVRFVPLKISLVEPPFGVSSSLLINFTVKTDKQTDCRYHTDERKSFGDRFPFERTYSIGNEMYYVRGNYQLSQNTLNLVSVMCLDPESNKYVNKTFSLIYDATNPEILNAEARPSVISDKNANNLYETTLVVNTDDKTVCKYDESSKSYSEMSDMFKNEDETDGTTYKTIHATTIQVTQEGNYDYYVSCRNLAGLTSSISKISFVVNESMPLLIIYISPEPNSIIARQKAQLIVVTNKDSRCLYGADSPIAESGTFSSAQIRHMSDEITLKQGTNIYYIQCNYFGAKGTERTFGSTTFKVDTTPPSKPVVKLFPAENSSPSGVTYLNDRLRANWTTEDAESGIVQYVYRVQDSEGNATTDWTPYITTDNSVSTIISGLSLDTGKRYLLQVSALNGANLWSSNGSSSPILVDVKTTPNLCKNNQFDPSWETDLDCGLQCPPCSTSFKCKVNSDCISGYCNNETLLCQKPSCSDNVKNGDELGVDCGGSCDDGCNGAENPPCYKDSDCSPSYVCKAGKCVEDTCNNGVKDFMESDVDCGGDCINSCEEGKKCYGDIDCASDLQCKNDICTKIETPKKEECTKDSDCQTGFVCKSNACVKKEEPANPGNKFSFWTFLIWAFVILLLAAGVFLVFSVLRKKPAAPKELSPFAPPGAEFGPMQRRPMMPVMRQAPRPIIERRREKLREKHRSVFEEFEAPVEQKETKVEEEPELKPEEKPQEKPVEMPKEEKIEVKVPEPVKEVPKEEPEEEKPEQTFKDLHEELVKKAGQLKTDVEKPKIKRKKR